jgi:hypothetical protein
LLSDSLREYEVLLRAVNVLHRSNGLKSLPKDFVPEFFRPDKFDDLLRDRTRVTRVLRRERYL